MTSTGRRLRYSVAMSLDGFIADVDGRYDWIVDDPTIDFEAYVAKLDALLMGRRTWEIMQAPEGRALLDLLDVYVVSTTLVPEATPDATIIASDVEERVRALKSQKGKDIWLLGGRVLFSSLLAAGLVDRVEVAVIPTLLGEGIPLLGAASEPTPLDLHSSEVFDSGIVLLKYDVVFDR